MKSYADYAMAVFEGILKDAAVRWPTSGHSLRLDLSYLRRALKERGLAFFTLTLPAYGYAIDRSLDHGSFLCELVPQGIKIHNGRALLFGRLLDEVFDTDDMLRRDACSDAVFILRTLTQCMKKLRVQYTASKLESTLDEFFNIERHLPDPWPNTWHSDVPEWSERIGHPLWGELPRTEAQEELFPLEHQPSGDLPWHTLRALARRVTAEIGHPDWWSLKPKHGPGVVSEKTGWESKYDFPLWPRKLDLWFPYDWFGAGQLCPDTWPDQRESPSRLIAVPKSQKGPRLICAEPIAHQWVQQGIWRWLDDRLQSTILRSTITFRSQDNSRKRALDSSLSGELATIDLSSASDRLSCRLVEYIFQGSPILDGMHACRTRHMVQTISENHPKVTLLRKFATMGSALTFPVQSIVFAILSIWAVRLVDGKADTLDGIEKTCREVTVFGDDIIVPTRAFDTVNLVLHECGLKVNTQKSFKGVAFRESCGMDAFRGVDVTPPRCLELYDGSPSSMATHVETANNFHKRGLWNAAEALVSMMPEKERKLLLVHRGEDRGLGLYSFCGEDLTHLKKGWDPNLQRVYSSALGLTATVDYRGGRGLSGVSQYFFEEPNPDFHWEAGTPGVTRLRKGRVRVYD